MPSKVPPKYKPPDPLADIRSLLQYGRNQGVDWTNDSEVQRALDDWVALEAVKAEFRKATDGIGD